MINKYVVPFVCIIIIKLRLYIANGNYEAIYEGNYPTNDHATILSLLTPF